MRTRNVEGEKKVAPAANYFAVDEIHKRLISRAHELAELSLQPLTPELVGEMEEASKHFNTDLAELRSRRIV